MCEDDAETLLPEATMMADSPPPGLDEASTRHLSKPQRPPRTSTVKPCSVSSSSPGTHSPAQSTSGSRQSSTRLIPETHPLLPSLSTHLPTTQVPPAGSPSKASVRFPIHTDLSIRCSPCLTTVRSPLHAASRPSLTVAYSALGQNTLRPSRLPPRSRTSLWQAACAGVSLSPSRRIPPAAVPTNPPSMRLRAGRGGGDRLLVQDRTASTAAGHIRNTQADIQAGEGVRLGS
mmetsp:Transcript_59287/g.142839  ORF Transcript_59287/g.142839 Transcript_59287/m.142839 type:complete len:232 (-) Transcript_59287:230-925(-)